MLFRSEDVKTPKSCTILIKGPNDYTIAQIKDAVRDGLRAVMNAMNDGKLIRGAGSFEIAAANHLRNVVRKSVQGRYADFFPALVSPLQTHLQHLTPHTFTINGSSKC